MEKIKAHALVKKYNMKLFYRDYYHNVVFYYLNIVEHHQSIEFDLLDCYALEPEVLYQIPISQSSGEQTHHKYYKKIKDLGIWKKWAQIEAHHAIFVKIKHHQFDYCLLLLSLSTNIPCFDWNIYYDLESGEQQSLLCYIDDGCRTTPKRNYLYKDCGRITPRAIPRPWSNITELHNLEELRGLSYEVQDSTGIQELNLRRLRGLPIIVPFERNFYQKYLTDPHV